MPARRIASLLHGLVGLGLLALGVRYTLAAQLMPYHTAVIDTPWSQLEPAYRTLFLGLLRGFGAGALCVGLGALLLAAHGFRSGADWAYRILAATSLGYTILLTWVTRGALPPGSRPIAISSALCALAAAAAILSLRRLPWAAHTRRCWNPRR